MTETLRDMMCERADRAPALRIDIDDVIRTGRNRVWRRRAVGGLAAGAALVAAVLVAPSLHLTFDDPGVAGNGAFEVRKVTYAEGSTIHYGDEAIDVPYEVRSFVQTDDGFVFADADDTIYFTNGDDTEAIGHGGGFTYLHADDSGSYVAWVEVDDGELPEIVVYDTSVDAEVFRSSDGNGEGPGYLSDYSKASVDALDGNTVYARNADGIVAIDIASETATTIIKPGTDSFLEDHTFLEDVADGWFARSNGNGVLVSFGSDGAVQRFPDDVGGDLSPNGRLLAAYSDRQATGQGLRLDVLDVASGSDVSPAFGSYNTVGLAQWIDNETVVVYRSPGGVDVDGDLLRCSISSGDCTMAARSVGSFNDIRLPWGYDTEGS
jgi:hypothetical protein